MSDCCLTPTRNRYIPSLFIPKYNGLVGCGFLWCLTPLSTILWRSVLFVEENVMPQVTDKFYHIMLYTSPRAGFELAMSVVIGIEYTMDTVKYGRI